MNGIPFLTIDWNQINKTIHPGLSGNAIWQTLEFNGLRIRLVEYEPGYFADHWCMKGHFVYCLDGEFTNELSSGEKSRLVKGMSYIVSDNLSSHRSFTETGVKLLIIDGDFLKPDI